MPSLTHTSRRLITRAVRPRAISALLFGFFIAAATACGGNDDGPSAPAGDGAIVGNYSLQQVDGRGLPVTIFDDDVETEDGRVVRLKIAVTRGSLDIDENEEFSGNLSVRLTVQGQSEDESLPLSGEYSRSGNTISFESDDPDGPSFEGRIRDGRLELELDIFGTGESITYTFKR